MALQAFQDNPQLLQVPSVLVHLHFLFVCKRRFCVPACCVTVLMRCGAVPPGRLQCAWHLWSIPRPVQALVQHTGVGGGTDGDNIGEVSAIQCRVS